MISTLPELLALSQQDSVFQCRMNDESWRLLFLHVCNGLVVFVVCVVHIWLHPSLLVLQLFTNLITSC